MKALRILPQDEEAAEEQLTDPREDLVRRLLEYKQFRDAAADLREMGRSWGERFPRRAVHEGTNEEDDPKELELWDLVTAYGRLSREHVPPPETSIIYDDTPIEDLMLQIQGQLVERSRLCFQELFDAAAHRSRRVGIFLAILELVRHHQIRAEQSGLFSEIWLYRSESFGAEVSLPDSGSVQGGEGLASRPKSVSDKTDTSSRKRQNRQRKPRKGNGGNHITDLPMEK